MWVYISFGFVCLSVTVMMFRFGVNFNLKSGILKSSWIDIKPQDVLPYINRFKLC